MSIRSSSFLFLSILTLGSGPVRSFTHAEDVFQSAILAENGERDLEKAVGLYKQAVRETDPHSPVHARALVRMGACYEKLGKVSEALLIYQSILKPKSGASAEFLQEAQAGEKRLRMQGPLLLNARDTQKIIAGGLQSAAIQNDGSLLWWGINPAFGKSLEPTLLEGFVNLAVFAWGASHGVALTQDGKVWTGGDNTYGQLGDGTTHAHLQPAEVKGLSGVIAIAAGQAHSLATKENGTVWTWGQNIHGQLGDKSLTERLEPVEAVGLSEIIAIAAGEQHSIALENNGTVWCWGHNSHGQLGVGSSFLVLPYPKKVPGLEFIEMIAAGARHTVALRKDGTVWTWGDNASGQLGHGPAEKSDTPLRVQGLGEIQAVAAGDAYTVALSSAGTVWAWGENSHGELGTGDTRNRAAPVRVENFNEVQSISAGAGHTLAIKKDGSVWAWGRNDAGQLGDRSIQDQLKPVRISSTAIN